MSRKKTFFLAPSRFFLSADAGSAFQSAVEAKSIAPFSQPGPIIPRLGPEEIQFHSQSVELGINKEWPIPGRLLLSLSHLLSHVSVSVMPLSTLSIHDRHNNRICRILLNLTGLPFSGMIIISETRVPCVT